jgi:hypothetical protein
MCGVGPEAPYMVASGWVTALTYGQCELLAEVKVKRTVSTPYASRQFGQAGYLKAVSPTGSELYDGNKEWAIEGLTWND